MNVWGIELDGEGVDVAQWLLTRCPARASTGCTGLFFGLPLLCAPSRLPVGLGGREGGRAGEESGRRNEHTVSNAKRHHQVDQPKQRVLLKVRAWPLLSRLDGLRHSAPGPRERPSKGDKGLLEGQELGSWAIPCCRHLHILNWFGNLERSVHCPSGGLDSVLTQLCDVGQFPDLSGPQLSYVRGLGQVTFEAHSSTDT